MNEIENNNNNNNKRSSDELEDDMNISISIKTEESDNANNHNNDGTHSDVRDVSQPPSKKLRSNDEELDIRFLVSSKEAGAIIGKGGANINHLRKHYKSSVTVPDCPGPERVLSIVASIDTLGDILKDVIGYIDDRSQTNSDREVELRLLIHTSHAGGIIGKGGQRIRDLRDQTKAAIKVFSQCCPLSTERICAIQGTCPVVINAIKTVLDIILASPIKGPVKLYDPYNFDVYAIMEYGGYTDPGPPGFRNRNNAPFMPFGNSGGRGSGGRMGRRNDSRGANNWHPDGGPHLPPPPDAWVSRMPYNGPAERRAPHEQMYSNRWLSSDNSRNVQSSSALPSSDQAPYWSDVIPNDDSAGGPPLHQINTWSSAYPAVEHEPNYGSAAGDDSNFIENADGSATATISVPNNVAGAIIGKGGNRIRLVRRDSGADIAIDSSVGPGNERTITVKGTVHQVRLACSMLRKSIAENTRRY